MKGEDDKLFDDFLRKSVGNYQVKPSPAIWKGILQKVPARRIGRIPFSGGHSGLIGFISGGIIISSVVLYNHNSNKHYKNSPVESAGTLSAQTISQKPADSSEAKTFVYNPQTTQTPEINAPKPAAQNTAIAAAASNTVIQQNKNNIEKTVTSNITPATTAFLPEKDKVTQASNLVQSAEKELIKDATPANTITDNKNTIKENTTLLASSNSKGSALADLRQIISNKSYYYDLAGRISQNLTLESDPSRANPKTMKISKWQGDYAESNKNLSAGIYYNPEWLSNTRDSKYGTTRQSGGLSLAWKKRPFILETGLGMMQEKAWQDYDLTLKKLLGTYNDLQSVSFDSIGGILVPHYNYVIDSVFDPNHITQQHSKLATYTYLQIPISIGIEKSYRRSCFSFKTGGLVSFLVDKNEEKLIIDADKHIIIMAGDHPDRLKTSLQWYVGIGYSYAITDQFSFFFEPALRGYVNTPYEKKRKPKDSPMYMGVRTGITFQFKNPFSK